MIKKLVIENKKILVVIEIKMNLEVYGG